MSKDYYGSGTLFHEDEILVCAGDVETEGLGGKLLMVQWGYLGQIFTASGPDMVEQFFDALLEMPKPAIWFFHFAQYDWRYFLEYLEHSGLMVEIAMRTETDIYEIRVKRTKNDSWCIMRDSYALWSHPLKKLAESFCPEIPKLEIEIEKFDPQKPDHIEYAKRDVQILMLGLPRLFDMIKEHFGVQPSATAAGTALKAWQKTLPKEENYDCSKYDASELFIREGYYGGLVFLTSNRAHENCITFDRNSSYPSAMLEHGVPTGKPIYTKEIEPGFEGMYRIRIHAPDDLIVPIIPCRNFRGAMQWRRGVFDTVVTNAEIEFALQHGYELIEVFEGFYFDHIAYPFNDFINLCRIIRNAFKGLTEEQVAKLLQNSLYGKFGSRRERTRLIHHSDLDEEALIGAMPFDESGLWYVKKELDEEMRCLPQWAAFITAKARLALLKEVYAVGPGNVLYGDTDSITIKANVDMSKLNIGNDYGQWKLEKEWEIFRAIAPKVYSGILKDGTFKGAAKGLPRKGITENQWRGLLEEGHTTAETLSLASLKVAMKKGVKPATKLLRKSSTLENSSNFIEENGNIRVKFSHG